jgi:hypothetical protein
MVIPQVYINLAIVLMPVIIMLIAIIIKGEF